MSKKNNFNQDIEKLEKIISDMEAGDLSLDEALKHYEKGIALVRTCQKAITNAEQRIIELSQEDNFTQGKDFSV